MLQSSRNHGRFWGFELPSQASDRLLIVYQGQPRSAILYQSKLLWWALVISVCCGYDFFSLRCAADIGLKATCADML